MKDKEFVRRIGSNILFLRESVLKMSRKDFSEKIGIGVSGLVYYEQGKRTPNAHVIYKICKEFHTDPGELLGLHGEMCLKLQVEETKIDIQEAIRALNHAYKSLE